MNDPVTRRVVDMHAAGEPVRFIVEYTRGRVRPGQRRVFIGAADRPVSGESVGTGPLGRLATITARVGGRARCSSAIFFRIGTDDPLADGDPVDRVRGPA